MGNCNSQKKNSNTKQIQRTNFKFLVVLGKGGFGKVFNNCNETTLGLQS